MTKQRTVKSHFHADMFQELMKNLMANHGFLDHKGKKRIRKFESNEYKSFINQHCDKSVFQIKHLTNQQCNEITDLKIYINNKLIDTRGKKFEKLNKRIVNPILIVLIYTKGIFYSKTFLPDALMTKSKIQTMQKVCSHQLDKFINIKNITEQNKIFFTQNELFKLKSIKVPTLESKQSQNYQKELAFLYVMYIIVKKNIAKEKDSIKEQTTQFIEQGTNQSITTPQQQLLEHQFLYLKTLLICQQTDGLNKQKPQSLDPLLNQLIQMNQQKLQQNPIQEINLYLRTTYVKTLQNVKQLFKDQKNKRKRNLFQKIQKLIQLIQTNDEYQQKQLNRLFLQ